MSFTNPLMLIGLAAILVPIIIHLFNFRRYKTVRFSNVQMLEDIQKKTKRASQVQQLIVLMLRVLGIACLVLAAAQPFLRGNDKNAKSGNVVSLFVDNSYSMETESQNGSRLYDAIDAAKNIVQTFDFSDDFVLTTQDFTGEESHILNKDQVLERRVVGDVRVYADRREWSVWLPVRTLAQPCHHMAKKQDHRGKCGLFHSKPTLK